MKAEGIITIIVVVFLGSIISIVSYVNGVSIGYKRGKNEIYEYMKDNFSGKIIGFPANEVDLQAFANDQYTDAIYLIPGQFIEITKVISISKPIIVFNDQDHNSREIIFNSGKPVEQVK